MSRNPTDLAAELRALSTPDRLVDVSVVIGTPTDHQCRRCHRLPVVFVAFDEAGEHYEHDLCVGCAREVIGQAETEYVDVEVYVPAVAL